jgi:hypothetical protein
MQGRGESFPLHHPFALPFMTAQQINHIAQLAIQRAHAAHREGACTLDAWDAIVRLQLLACSVASREIAANGYSWAFAPLP